MPSLTLTITATNDPPPAEPYTYVWSWDDAVGTGNTGSNSECTATYDATESGDVTINVEPSTAQIRKTASDTPAQSISYTIPDAGSCECKSFLVSLGSNSWSEKVRLWHDPKLKIKHNDAASYCANCPSC